jgi:hypothetical protein
VAITNANDGRPRDNRGNARLNENQRPGTSRETGNKNSANEQKSRDFKPFNPENKPYKKDAKDHKSYSTYNRDNKPYNKDSKPGGGKDARDQKPSGYRSRDQKGSGYNKDKDLDSDNKYGKGYGGGKDQRMGDSRAKTAQSKEKEQQPDKLETIKRLEKEKKVLQKKSQENDRNTEKPSKPAIKHRRTNTIDWTKGYANGLYGDDDEDYTEFM